MIEGERHRKRNRMVRLLGATALTCFTLSAAAWWTYSVILLPRSIRANLVEDLGPFFPGGFRFQGAQKTGPGRYRVRRFEAFPHDSRSPWLTAETVDFILDAEGDSLSRILLVRPVLRLESGPAFLAPGSFTVPPGRRRIPCVEVEGGVLYGPLPGAGSMRVGWARDLTLRFDPDASQTLTGAFATSVGSFRVKGSVDPLGRSALRAVLTRPDLSGLENLFGTAGPVSRTGEGAGAFTFAFGGGGLPVLAGSLTLEEVRLEGVAVSLRNVLLVVRGAQGGAWAPALNLAASTARWETVVFEDVRLRVASDAGVAATGSARLWGGEMELEGGRGEGFWGRGSLRGADLRRMPPDLFGAVTPTAGEVDVDFALEGGALAGDFSARDAALWSVPFLSGIRSAVPGFSTSRELFRTVRGRFVHEGERTVLPALAMEAGSFRLDLARPGRIGPHRRLDLEFLLRLHHERREGGLGPMRKVFEVLSDAVWKPFEKFILLRIRVGGTLDAPVHALLPVGRDGR